MTARDWAPVRDGLRYCSPACGYGCTIVEHDAAVIAANALVEALGPRWEARVWENLGWHYAAHLQGFDIEVHPNIDKRTRAPRLLGYFALGHFPESINVKAEGDTPTAVRASLREELRTIYERLSDAAASLREVIA